MYNFTQYTYYIIHLHSYRYEQDPQGKEKVSIIYPEIDDVFGLKLHSCDIDKDFLCLSAAIPDGFILFFKPLIGDYKQLDRQVKKLKLPRSVVNIRIKLNQSNPCIMVPSMGYLIAGVRRDVFVWNWDKEQLLRSFMGHMGRILDMRALVTPVQKLFLTSSADKTIKVWDVDNLLEYVHPVDQMDMKIDKLLMCEELKSIISLTRGGLGFWNLETGSLDFQISDNAGGKFLYFQKKCPINWEPVD